MSIRSLTFALVAATHLVCLPAALAQLVPVGPEFQVNSYTTSFQGYPVVAVGGSGNFVVVWESYGGLGDPSTGSVQGQRYNAAGTPVGSQFQVNSYTTSFQGYPAVAIDGSGNFVVIWASYGSVGGDTSSGSIQGQRYNAAGAPVGSQFQVNSYTTSSQHEPAVAADPVGNFVVVWQSYGSAGSDTSFSSVQGQRYDSAGTPVGGEFQVNSYTTSYQSNPTVAVDPAGNFVVAWQSYASTGSDSSGYSIQGQRYDASGTPAGGEFQVNSYTTYYQDYPAVAVDPAGNFVVVWSSYGSAGSDPFGYSVQGQRYDAAGTPVGAEFQVNSYTTSFQVEPAVAVDPAGNFVVAWKSDTSGLSIQGQRYDAAGTPVGGEFRVNSYMTIFEGDPAVAVDGSGNFVVAWESGGSAGSDTSSFSIQAQRYAPGRTILGKKILVKDPNGSEPSRTVVALAKETTTDIGPTFLGDPVANGATLRVITNGTTSSDETYILDAAGWSAISIGFKYLGPTAGDGDPVKKILLKRNPNGTALMKAIIKGNVGTQSMDVLPPNLGDDGGIILTIPGGGTYCALFGGAAGGTEAKDDGRLWKVTNPTAQGCPTP